ncbi:MAG: hypothetical protein ACRD1V_09155 [Vicinamibacterales bacterium]
MTDKKYTVEELVGQLRSPGWRLTDDGGEPVEGTLEHVARAAYDRRQAGGRPGLLQRIGNAIEIDMLDLEKLWRQLGLPT